MKKYSLAIAILIFQFMHTGCNPEFLDLKRDKAQMVPTSLSDFKAILDNFADINGNSGYSLGILSADEYYILDETWDLLSAAHQRNAYIWTEDIFESEDGMDWNTSYKKILYANLVLEGLDKLTPATEDMEEYRHIKGSALFLRGLAYYNLSQLFSPTLADSENNQYGLPLRLESDPTVVSERSSVEETYRQIIQDVSSASEFLSDTFVINTRPTRKAAYALLSRIYLQIGEYEKSLGFAESALAIDGTLLDFNTVDPSKRYPFPPNGAGNPEVIYYEVSNTSTVFTVSRSRIDTNLYDLYDEDDLRKDLYFYENTDGSHSFRGSYCGAYVYFTGPANDELYLNKAEVLIRSGNIQDGLDVLNTLLINRYRTDHFHPYMGMNQREALQVVLSERRKELLLRGVRWSDLRRLNRHKETEKTLERTLHDTKYELPPNDSKYTFPVPESVIINSNIKQFPRK